MMKSDQRFPVNAEVVPVLRSGSIENALCSDPLAGDNWGLTPARLHFQVGVVNRLFEPFAGSKSYIA